MAILSDTAGSRCFISGPFMKRKISGWIDLLAASVNYIVICFALSHMEICFQHDPAFILFSASQIWVTGAFWGKVQKTADNRLVPAILTAACFLIHAGLVYMTWDIHVTQ